MAELYRFAAFISYSSKDAAFAKRLHRALESYHIPAQLGSFDLVGGGKKNRIFPVFRDREELPSGELGDAIGAALKASNALIIVCSPNAAASPWVNKEIETFLSFGRRDRIFAIIADDAPLTDANGADATAQSFPPAFRGEGLADGAAGFEPLAADARKGKDGFRAAWLKVVAGLIGVNAGALADRDAKRQRVQRVQIGAGLSAAVLALALGGAALDALIWRTDLTQAAEVILRDGRPTDAAALALGGAVAAGAVLTARDSTADDLLRRASGARWLANIGPVDNLALAANGASLVALGADSEKTATRIDLQSGAKTALGPVGPLIRWAIAANGAAFLMHRDDATQTGALLHLDSGAVTELGALGPLRNMTISSDGARAAFFPGGASNVGEIRSFADGARTDLGPLRLFVPADQGGILLVQRDHAQESWARIDLDGGPTIELAPLGPHRSFTSSRDGSRMILFRLDASETATAIDLKTGARAELGALGPTRMVTLSGDGDVFGFERDDAKRTVAVMDLRTGRTVELGAFGRLRLLDLSASGDKAVFHREGEDATGVLVDIKSGAKRELGPLAHFAFSSDGARLVLHRKDTSQSGAVLDLATGQLMELGALGELYNFYPSADGNALVVYRWSGDATVLDLRQPLDLAARGAGLVSAVCSANAQHLRPFSVEQRGQGGAQMDAKAAEEAKAIAAILKGRPWNPCDWRGIAAIFPNPARGDGWFEGPRQWLRLMHVRHFGGKDWSCAETLPKASARQKAARLEMCELYGPRATEVGQAAGD